MNVNIINDVMSPARECRVLRAGGGDTAEIVLGGPLEQRWFRPQYLVSRISQRYKSTTPLCPGVSGRLVAAYVIVARPPAPARAIAARERGHLDSSVTARVQRTRGTWHAGLTLASRWLASL